MGWGLHKCISSFVVISRKKCKIDALFSLPEYVDLVARASETHTWRWWRKKKIYSVWVEHVLVYYYIFITQINCLMSLSVSSQAVVMTWRHICTPGFDLTFLIPTSLARCLQSSQTTIRTNRKMKIINRHPRCVFLPITIPRDLCTPELTLR